MMKHEQDRLQRLRLYLRVFLCAFRKQLFFPQLKTNKQAVFTDDGDRGADGRS